MTSIPKSRSEASDRYPVDRLITALAASNLPWATARLVRLLITRVSITANSQDASTKASRRVLLLPRRGFTDDILTTLSTIPSLDVIALKRRRLKAIASAFLPKEIDDNNYVVNSSSTKAAMRAYRDFLCQFWQALDPSRRINAVLSGNFGYYAEQEFAAALESLGVPFIALHKENSWSPGNQSFWEAVYRERRAPFRGRRILVYSPIERDLQLRAGVVDRDRIEVTGMPRLDVVHRWRQSNVGLVPKPTVLFASFLPEVGMPFLSKTTQAPSSGCSLADQEVSRTMSLTTLCRSVHRAILKLAIENPNMTILIKTKGRERDRMGLAKLLGIAEEGDLPANAQVIHGGSPLPAIAQASVVCGLHSTLLLEALAAGRPVIVPWYAEALNPEIRRYLFDLGPAVLRAASADEFVERVRSVAQAQAPVPATLPPETQKFLREWVGNDDGKASERAAAAILRTIEAAASALGSLGRARAALPS